MTAAAIRTVFSASELGQDAKGAGLGSASFGMPVLGVLHQALLACVADRVIVCVSFPA